MAGLSRRSFLKRGALAGALVITGAHVVGSAHADGVDGGGGLTYGPWYIEDRSDGNRYWVRGIYDENGNRVGEQTILIGPTPSGNGAPAPAPPDNCSD